MTWTRKDLARIFGRIVVDAQTGCWNWQGHLVFGYGSVRIGGRQQRVHRAVYESFVGVVPQGLQLDHLCRNRRCANPAHLEVVTNQENVLRGVGPTAVNAAKTACRLGHPLSGENLVMVRGERWCRLCKIARARKARATAKRKHADELAAELVGTQEETA